MTNNDKTIREESVPPVSSGAEGIDRTLLQSGMLQPPPAPGLIGTVGRYEILRVLGEGGMGQVLLAREPVTDSQVAIKMIRPEFLHKDWAVHRFLSEARHMFKMAHPAILPVMEISDRREGPYFVMPYMAGGSLAQRIGPGEPLAAEAILPVARAVAEALDFAHGRGVIHRDLKPSNILLADDGRAFLADFGLLRTVFNDSMVDVTQQRLEGTVPYLSPAVAEGQAEDTRCDIYAFGCLLYEMLTGQPPYQGPTVEAVLRSILAGPPRPIREINPKASPALVRVAEGCMARELRDRYAAMSDVAADLVRISSRREPLGPRGTDRSHDLRQMRIWGGGIAAAGLVAAATWAVTHSPWMRRDKQEQASTTPTESSPTVALLLPPFPTDSPPVVAAPPSVPTLPALPAATAIATRPVIAMPAPAAAVPAPPPPPGATPVALPSPPLPAAAPTPPGVIRPPAASVPVDSRSYAERRRERGRAAEVIRWPYSLPQAPEIVAEAGKGAPDLLKVECMAMFAPRLGSASVLYVRAPDGGSLRRLVPSAMPTNVAVLAIDEGKGVIVLGRNPTNDLRRILQECAEVAVRKQGRVDGSKAVGFCFTNSTIAGRSTLPFISASDWVTAIARWTGRGILLPSHAFSSASRGRTLRDITVDNAVAILETELQAGGSVVETLGNEVGAFLTVRSTNSPPLIAEGSPKPRWPLPTSGGRTADRVVFSFSNAPISEVVRFYFGLHGGELPDRQVSNLLWQAETLIGSASGHTPPGGLPADLAACGLELLLDWNGVEFLFEGTNPIAIRPKMQLHPLPPGVIRAPTTSPAGGRSPQVPTAPIPPQPKLQGVDLQKHLEEYQMAVIRKGMPPLPVPLTKEQDDQLVREGVLPPLTPPTSSAPTMPATAAPPPPSPPAPGSPPVAPPASLTMPGTPTGTGSVAAVMGASMETRSFRLSDAKPSEVRAILLNILQSDGIAGASDGALGIAADDASQTVTVTSHSSNFHFFEMLMHVLDRKIIGSDGQPFRPQASGPGRREVATQARERQTRTYELQRADANAIARTLQATTDFLAKGGHIAKKVETAAGSTPKSLNVTADDGDFPLIDPLVQIADCIGSNDGAQAISPPGVTRPGAGSPTATDVEIRIYEMHYIDPMDIVKAHQLLIEPKVPGRMRIAGDARTATLIVMANRKQFALLDLIVKAMDR